MILRTKNRSGFKPAPQQKKAFPKKENKPLRVRLVYFAAVLSAACMRNAEYGQSVGSVQL